MNWAKRTARRVTSYTKLEKYLMDLQRNRVVRIPMYDPAGTVANRYRSGDMVKVQESTVDVETGESHARRHRRAIATDKWSEMFSRRDHYVIEGTD